MAKALIAEPNLRLAHRLAQELEPLGLQVEFARDGASAIKSFAGGDYRLILVNLVLPQMSGAEVARKMRSSPKGKEVCIEVMSPTLKDPTAVDRLCAELSLGPYFKMPFNFGFFRSVTKNYLVSGVPAGSLSAVEQHRLAADKAQEQAPAPTATPAQPAPAARSQESTPPPPPVAVQPAPATSPARPAPQPVAAAAPAPAPVSPAAQPAAAPSTVAPAAAPSVITWGTSSPLRSFDQVLLKLRSDGFTGNVRLQGPDSLKMLTLARGFPVDAVSLHPARPFSEYASRKHNLDPKQRAALARQVKEPDDELLLVQMGALSWDEFLDTRRAFVASELAGCFGWTSGEAHLDPRPETTAGPLARHVGLPILIAAFAEGSRELAKDAKAAAELEARITPNFLARTPLFYEYANLLPYAPETEGFLEKITGRRPFGDILKESSDKNAAMRLARMLLMLGMLQLSASPHADAISSFPYQPLSHEVPAPQPAITAVAAPPAPQTRPAPAAPPPRPAAPAPAPKPAAAKPADTLEIMDLGADLLEDLGEVVESVRSGGATAQAAAPSAAERKLEDELIDELERVKKSDYYKIFDSRRNAFKFQDVKQKYFELQRRFSPDKFIMSPAEIMSKCEEYLEIISKAFETLSDIKKKMAYDDQLSKQKIIADDRKAGGGLQANVAFESGRALLKEGDPVAAEQEIRKAMRLAPNNMEYEVYLARALYLNPVTQKDMGQQVKVRQMLDRALVKAPKLGIAYAFRASIFLDQGKFDLAATDLLKALKFDPQCLHAKQEQRRLQELQQQKR